MFTREAIINWLYVGEANKPSLRNVDVYVSQLRKKLNENEESIECARGYGYMLVQHTA